MALTARFGSMCLTLRSPSHYLQIILLFFFFHHVLVVRNLENIETYKEDRITHPREKPLKFFGEFFSVFIYAMKIIHV